VVRKIKELAERAGHEEVVQSPLSEVARHAEAAVEASERASVSGAYHPSFPSFNHPCGIGRWNHLL